MMSDLSVTITAMIPPSRLTFELAAQLVRELRAFGSEISFKDYTGTFTVTTEVPSHHEALRVLRDADAILLDIRGDDLKSFSEYFGTKLPLDLERATVYCQMCQEGRVW